MYHSCPEDLWTESRSFPFDAQRIYGEDILACLPSPQDPNVVYTFVFDACASETLLGYRYDETGVHAPPSNTPLHDMQAQIIAVSAARRDELAGTLTVRGIHDHGALTHYLLRCLSTLLFSTLATLFGEISQPKMRDEGPASFRCIKAAPNRSI
ncbi:hypothetical protein FRC05_009631 [Tulasnella sp. 425]|nr:hypothetical protein FRC05_009631 [Tulasnella sp. 425]